MAHQCGAICAGECLLLLSETMPLKNQCSVLLIANFHFTILVKLQKGIMTTASSNKWPTNVVPYVLENACCGDEIPQIED